MPTPEAIDVVQPIEHRTRGACLVSGCPCKDSRIVSSRRAGFFAALARRSGQTADRVIDGEPEWRIPTSQVAAAVQP